MGYKNFLVILCIFLLFIGCVGKVEKPSVSLVPVSSRDYPSFADDLDKESLERAVLRSLEYYERLPNERVYYFGSDNYTVGQIKESLVDFLDIIRTSDSPYMIEKRVRDTFEIYKSVGNDGNGTVLYTGYYAPVLRGSLVKNGEYKYPVYRTPDNHIVVNLADFNDKYRGDRIIARYENGKVVPYYTRENIDSEDCLRNKGLEIAWLSDPVDIFFLHIQGSGIVSLPDGSFMRISYDQSNGHPYRSVGRLLVDQGKLSMDEISLKSIKRYLHEHPEEMAEILNHNKSYVFFRVVEDGPIGSLNIPVTSGRTIATDASFFPKGALAFIKTRKPVIDENGIIVSWSAFSRFVMNQDTGGAINGPGRVDLFCGKGKLAEVMAGHMKENGELYFLVKKKRDTK